MEKWHIQALKRYSEIKVSIAIDSAAFTSSRKKQSEIAKVIQKKIDFVRCHLAFLRCD